MGPHRLTALVLISFMAASLWAPSVGMGNLLPVDAIGRLVLNGRMVCTAFSIRSEELPTPPGSETASYRNWLVTAGHCLEQVMFRGQPAFLVHASGGRISYPAQAYPAVPAAFSGGRPWGFDVAVLLYWTSRPVPVLEPAFDQRLRKGDQLLLAGYPGGVLSFSIGPYIGRSEDEQLLVDTRLSPGSSGGPVLIPGTRKVVGIIVEGTPKQAQHNPSACWFKRCPADRPYKAAPIDSILRVVRW